jgi:hypothetical protein
LSGYLSRAVAQTAPTHPSGGAARNSPGDRASLSTGLSQINGHDTDPRPASAGLYTPQHCSGLSSERDGSVQNNTCVPVERAQSSAVTACTRVPNGGMHSCHPERSEGSHRRRLPRACRQTCAITSLEGDHRPVPPPPTILRNEGRRAQYMCWPPLIDSVEPVMKPASSAIRNITPRAISSALPSRPTGILATIFSSTLAGTAATMSVSV